MAASSYHRSQERFFFASQRLADLLNEQHSDPWLADLIRSLQASGTAGMLELRDAIQANRQQLTDSATKHAALAAAAFRKNRNLPGELRARYESVYANQRSMNGDACLREAEVLEKLLRSTSYHELLAEALLQKAICENRAGRPGNIDTSLNASGALAQTFGFKRLQLRILGKAAALKKEADSCKAAWTLISKGIDLYWEGSYPAETLYQFYAVAAECAERRHQWHTAEVLRRHTIRIREGMDPTEQDPIMLGTIYRDLGTILIALKQDGPAAEAFAHAEAILKAYASETAVQRFRSTVMVRLARLRLESGNEDLALSTLLPVLDLAKQTGDHLTTLQYYGVLGDIYLRARNTEAAAEAYQKGLVFSENALSTLSSSAERLAWISAAEGVYRGLARAWLLQPRPADAWKLWQWYKGRPLKSERELDSVPIRSWAKLQAAILQPADSDWGPLRVTYASFADGLQIWVNQSGRISSHWISIQQQRLEEKTQEFFDDCSDSSSELTQLWKSGEELYSAVWGPIATELPESGHIAVELDGPLQNIPLEALRTPANKYLAEQYTIVYSPGKEMDHRLRPGLKAEKNTRVFLLDASVVDGIAPIPSQSQEVQFISHKFSNSKIVSGADATLASVRDELRKSHIFFFAGHAISDGNGPGLLINATLVAKAKEFRAQELSSLQLAFLAACSTGSTDHNGLSDTQSLTNTFLAAGVPNVIASRWDVESDSTSDLVQRFAGELEKGRSPATALSAARRNMITTLRHPYYWAGFYIAGQPH